MLEKEINKSIKEDVISRGLILALPLILFAYLFLFKPIGIYNDSGQYIDMHIHRDPLYPLFLYWLRKVFGEGEIYLKAAVFFQNFLAWLSIKALTDEVKKKLGVGNIGAVITCIICMLPHIITPLVAQSGLILSNSIMSEAITIPLFYFFCANMIGAITDGKLEDKSGALVMAVLLSLARGQMMVMIIVWMITEIYLVVQTKKQILIRLLVVIIAFLISFTARSGIVKNYNKVFNGYYTSTTMGTVSLLTNIMYSADLEDALLIEDETTRAFYLFSMMQADESKYNYKYCAPGLLNRAADIEDKHDRIKFECIDERWRQVHYAIDEVYQNDYVLETIDQDRIAGEIIKAIWADNFKTWLYDYFALIVYGLIRTVAFVNPIFNFYAYAICILFICAIVYYAINRKKDNNEQIFRLLMLTFLMVCANVFATASVIMCLSRYMVYTLPMVYISIIAVVKELLLVKYIQK